VSFTTSRFQQISAAAYTRLRGSYGGHGGHGGHFPGAVVVRVLRAHFLAAHSKHFVVGSVLPLDRGPGPAMGSRYPNLLRYMVLQTRRGGANDGVGEAVRDEGGGRDGNGSSSGGEGWVEGGVEGGAGDSGEDAGSGDELERKTAADEARYANAAAAGGDHVQSSSSSSSSAAVVAAAVAAAAPAPAPPPPEQPRPPSAAQSAAAGAPASAHRDDHHPHARCGTYAGIVASIRVTWVEMSKTLKA